MYDTCYMIHCFMNVHFVLRPYLIPATFDQGSPPEHAVYTLFWLVALDRVILLMFSLLFCVSQAWLLYLSTVSSYCSVNRVGEHGSIEEITIIVYMSLLLNKPAWNYFEVLFELQFTVFVTSFRYSIRISPHWSIRWNYQRHWVLSRCSSEGICIPFLWLIFSTKWMRKTKI